MSRNIFVIAGEASGDALGGPLMEALKRGDPSIQFEGVGGDKMQAAGLESLLPMEELCVMGLFEVLGHLPRLLRLIKAIVEEIEARQPDVVVTIDLPDFNFRVAKLLKKRGIFKGKIIHYVAPTVWAWRPGRAKKIAQFLDGLMCLFPFEPEYFTKHGLKAVYVGHSLTQRDLSLLDGKAFREARQMSEDACVLTVMFGSRLAELKAHGAIFVEAIEYIAEQEPDLELFVPTLPHLEYDVLELLNGLDVPATVVVDQEDKWQGFVASDVAMAVSGTAALELAYAGAPHVIGYRTGWLTWVVLKMVVKTKFAHLANILLGRDKPAVPEFLQMACTPAHLATGVLTLLKDESATAKQKAAFEGLRGVLATKQPPSEVAAGFVLER